MTVLAGIRAKVGERVRVDHAPGVPVVQRVFPSMFDMFGGNKPEDPEGFDAEAEFRHAVGHARGADVAVVVVGERQTWSARLLRDRRWSCRDVSKSC